MRALRPERRPAIALVRQMLRKPYREGDDRQRRIGLARGREDGGTRDKEVGRIEATQVAVHHAVGPRRAHARRADLMRAVRHARNDGVDVFRMRLAIVDFRDPRLLRTLRRHGYFVRAIEPLAQTIEVARRFDLFDRVQPFHRCVRCNGLVTPVPKATVLDQLLPKTRLYFDEFHR